MDEFLRLIEDADGSGVYLLDGEWECFIDEYDEDEEDDDEDEGEEVETATEAEEAANSLKAYKVECVEQFGGGEGGGDTVYSVYSVEKDGKQLGFFKAYGWYASHYGSEYEGVCEVKPKQKWVTVYLEEGEDDE